MTLLSLALKIHEKLAQRKHTEKVYERKTVYRKCLPAIGCSYKKTHGQLILVFLSYKSSFVNLTIYLS